MGILKNGMHIEASISFFKTFTIIFFPKLLNRYQSSGKWVSWEIFLMPSKIAYVYL
jgi:hypothetical protein